MSELGKWPKRLENGPFPVPRRHLKKQLLPAENGGTGNWFPQSSYRKFAFRFFPVPVNPLFAMKKLGYARVSTQEQVLDLQLDALRQAGCDDVFTDTVSGVQAHKPNWKKLLAYARSGDTVVIWRLDRLGRSTKHLIEVVEDLSRRGLHLISLQDPINTTSPGGQLVFQIFCALAEHERNVLVQRTRAGLQAARARGRQGGRPPGLAPRYQKIAPAVKELYGAGQQSTRQLMDYFQIGSRRTLYKILRFAGCQINEKTTVPATKAVDKALP
jgi:DNA invertase Pin-like site-specific DNA recombinase